MERKIITIFAVVILILITVYAFKDTVKDFIGTETQNLSLDKSKNGRGNESAINKQSEALVKDSKDTPLQPLYAFTGIARSQ